MNFRGWMKLLTSRLCSCISWIYWWFLEPLKSSPAIEHYLTIVSLLSSNLSKSKIWFANSCFVGRGLTDFKISFCREDCQIGLWALASAFCISSLESRDAQQNIKRTSKVCLKGMLANRHIFHQIFIQGFNRIIRILLQNHQYFRWLKSCTATKYVNWSKVLSSNSTNHFCYQSLIWSHIHLNWAVTKKLVICCMQGLFPI